MGLRRRDVGSIQGGFDVKSIDKLDYERKNILHCDLISRKLILGKLIRYVPVFRKISRDGKLSGRLRNEENMRMVTLRAFCFIFLPLCTSKPCAFAV